MRLLSVHAEPWETASNVRGQPMPSVTEHFESLGSWICHVVWQVDTESQSWTGFVPYSHSRPEGEHAVLGAGSFAGHGDAGPPSTHAAPSQPPLLPLPLLVPPLLLPPPSPPPLLPLLLPLPPPLLSPPGPTPASVSVLKADPPQANDTAPKTTTSALPQDDCLMRAS
jgi:hypothetical protein